MDQRRREAQNRESRANTKLLHLQSSFQPSDLSEQSAGYVRTLATTLAYLSVDFEDLAKKVEALEARVGS